MKKYPITFTTDYTMYEEWANDTSGKFNNEHWKKKIKSKSKELQICKKWKGKEITLLELEDIIDEIGEVIFDGETIEVYNNYRE